MYDELIAALRFCDNGECDGCCKYIKGKGTECYTLLRDAADAIEELSKRVPRVPHGRLIDADVLTEFCRYMQSIEWNKHAAPYSWAYAYEDFENVILDAPTIIPAEEAPGEDINAPPGPYDLLYEEGGANTT